MLFNFHWDDQLEAYVIREENKLKRWVIFAYLFVSTIPFWIYGILFHGADAVGFTIKKTNNLKKEYIDKLNGRDK